MQYAANRARLILASKSPRRRYLLEKAGLEFEVVPSELDESSVMRSSPESQVKCLAEAKALDVANRYPDCWIIAADTIVFIDGIILGKPTSRDEAQAMLKRLSAQTHQVHTGYCIGRRQTDHFFSDCVTTDVSFKNVSNKEIDWYINSGEPFGKAGAYAIQGIGAFMVKHINGSYTNVVGLPVYEVLEYLYNEGAIERTLI